jgi:NADPH-dependent 2,4-dienoyl-CoA reductase/sulfur reductase-like enzyme
MEAARVAAHRGHVVTLLEAGERLGGTAWLSELTTPENGPFLRWQEHQLDLEGVDVRTGVSATVEGVWDLHPDVVVVATGARRGRPDVPGADLPHVRSGDDLRALLTGGSPAGARSSGRSLLERVLVPLGRTLRMTNAPRRIRLLSKVWMPVGRDVVVVGGGLVGLELAEFLARRRRRVTLLENGPVLGLPMAMPRRLATVASAASDGVRLVRGARLVEITADHVAYEVAGQQQAVTAGTVVLTGEVRPDATLADRLRESGTDVRVAGDADVIGYLYGAVHSGWRVGLEL